MKKPRFSPCQNKIPTITDSINGQKNPLDTKSSYQIQCEREMLKMQFHKKTGDEITLEEVIENCADELTKYRSKFYDMGNDIQIAEDYCHKIQSFLDDDADNTWRRTDKEWRATNANVVNLANLCAQNLYGAKQMYYSLKKINNVEKFFDPVYG